MGVRFAHCRTTAAGIGVLEKGRTIHRQVVFLRPSHGNPLWAGCAGESSDSPVPFPGTPILYGLPTPIGVGVGGKRKPLEKEAIMPTTTPASTSPKKKAKPSRTMIDEVFALARQQGWTSLRPEEKHLIDLLRETTYHGRNLVVETARAMRSAHPWRFTIDPERSKANTATCFPSGDSRFFTLDGNE